MKAGMINGANYCLNCAATLDGPYCSQCGQKQARRLTVHSILHEFARMITNLESSFVRTLIGMATKPGSTCLDYSNGMRKPYVNPVKYAFFAVTVFILLITLFNVNLVPPYVPRQAAQDASMRLVLSISNYRIFLTLLPLAGIQRLLFRKGRHNFAECYMFCLFVIGHYMLYFGLLALPGWYSTWLGYALIHVVEVTYLAWALIGFYGASVLAGIAKGLLMAIAFFLFNSLTAILFIAVWRLSFPGA